MKRLARALAALLLVTVLGGCASWPFRPAAMLLVRADRASDELRFRQALALYDEFLTRYPDDTLAPRALESRNTVAAIVTTRDELTRLRSELRARESEAVKLRDDAARMRDEAAKLRDEAARLRDEVAKLRDEVARVRQELSTRQAESDKLRADLERMKELDLRLERRR
jgi:hypothetical protein